MSLRPLITVCGTTGVGKSKLAIELALALSQNGAGRPHGFTGARIINADAMQVYTGMDVITNKMPVEERSGVEHLLMDIKQPGEQYIVTQWVQDAMKVIEETHQRNQIPIVVGGTSYWIQHLVFPNRLVSFDKSLKETLEVRRPELSADLAMALRGLSQELQDLFDMLPEQAPSAASEPDLALSLHSLLSALDSQIAQRWHWRDTRKVLRNLTIIRDTGRRPSDIFSEQSQATPPPRYRTLCLWLYAQPDVLKPRLDARVDDMVKQGLLDEIRALQRIAASIPSTALPPSQDDPEDMDVDESPQDTDYTLGIYQSIGYKEFHDYLSSPTHSEEAFNLAVENMKSATRKYAKRQIMWIRNKLLPAADEANAASTVEGGLPMVPSFLLDATELGEAWDRNVREVAERITEGRPLPDPLILSDTAREVLGRINKDTHGFLDARPRKVCSICTVNHECPVMIAEGREWEAHVRTRTHRKLLRKANRPDNKEFATKQRQCADKDAEDAPKRQPEGLQEDQLDQLDENPIPW
ncbi:tRNA isopentenyltransferase [Wolfiporia cocos MD-104 SS10]|uniref:tRNA isopentenyltransferase n=1 Tax=Wolfiporia cocos (strain MD-104) TaxID=742152 RepID=A0A2H3J8P0_WOLCO|nr:tRNA isopentenyltransferase [Wolfiporia cocos MD-104 SS10]